MSNVHLDASQIADKMSFHEVCADAFGFPGFYVHNMDEWVLNVESIITGGDCTRFGLLSAGEQLLVYITDTAGLRERVPAVFADLIGGCASVNQSAVARGRSSALILVLA